MNNWPGKTYGVICEMTLLDQQYVCAGPDCVIYLSSVMQDDFQTGSSPRRVLHPASFLPPIRQAIKQEVDTSHVLISREGGHSYTLKVQLYRDLYTVAST